VIIYHGTTSSRAHNIVRNGFSAFNLAREVAVVGERFGMSSEDIFSKFRATGRISLVRADDNSVYFSSGFNHAHSYASRAPEVVWESLWAVFLINHPDVAHPWNLSDEGHYWVLRQLSHDRPTVLEIEVEDELLGVKRDQILRSRLLASAGSDNGVEVALSHTLDLRILLVHEFDRRVDGSLLRFMTGLSPEELHASVERGEWGEVGTYRYERYWRWHDVIERLPAGRLDELDELVQGSRR
jgi:hypothetical protein